MILILLVFFIRMSLIVDVIFVVFAMFKMALTADWISLQIINLPRLMLACSTVFSNAADSALKIEQNGSKLPILIQFPFSFTTANDACRSVLVPSV